MHKNSYYIHEEVYNLNIGLHYNIYIYKIVMDKIDFWMFRMKKDEMINMSTVGDCIMNKQLENYQVHAEMILILI